MKNPNTPMLKRQNHRKNSFGIVSIFQEVKVPVNTMIEDKRSMATEMPSTPME